MKTGTEQLAEKLSTVTTPNRDLQAAAMMLGDAAARVDVKFVKRSTDLAHRLLLSLKKALPETDQQLLGDFVAEINDLWVYGEKLDNILNDICGMRFPRDAKLLREALVSVEVQQFDYALDCIKGLQQTLPKLKRALDRRTKKGNSR
jgi:hypothetical protein